MCDDVIRDPEGFRERVAERLRGLEKDFSEKMRLVREGRAAGRPCVASGVLVPLEYDRGTGEHAVVLNKRSDRVQQAGDLCFPGGHVDPGKDRLLARLLVWNGFPPARARALQSLRQRAGLEEQRVVRFILAGALRESWEEMRLMPWNVEYLGALPTHHLLNHPRIIFPVVGRIRGRWRARPNWEVEKVLRLPVRAFFDPGNHLSYRLNLPGPLQEKTGMDHWELPGLAVRGEGGEEEILWGATFRILLNFMERVLDLKWEGIRPSRRVEKDLPENYFQTVVRSPYQRTIAEAQVNPDPKLASMTCWPCRRSPFCRASWSAMGIDPAVVFPYSWMLL